MESLKSPCEELSLGTKWQIASSHCPFLALVFPTLRSSSWSLRAFVSSVFVGFSSALWACTVTEEPTPPSFLLHLCRAQDPLPCCPALFVFLHHSSLGMSAKYIHTIKPFTKHLKVPEHGKKAFFMEENMENLYPGPIIFLNS